MRSFLKLTDTNIIPIMKYIRILFASCCLLFAGCITDHLSAQDIQSDVSGFYGNVNVYYGQWNTESEFLEGIREHDPNGWGLQLSGGYGFNQKMEAFLQLSYIDYNLSGDWSTFTHTGFGAGFRYNFGATLSKVRPFLDVQISTSSIEIDRIYYEHAVAGLRIEGKLDMEGLTYIGGGGIRYFFRPWIAGKVHARFLYGPDYNMAFEGLDLTFPDKQDVSQFDLGVGITWYFGKNY